VHHPSPPSKSFSVPSKLVFKRIDGESTGEVKPLKLNISSLYKCHQLFLNLHGVISIAQVQFGHLVGLFATSEAGSVYRFRPVAARTLTCASGSTSRRSRPPAPTPTLAGQPSTQCVMRAMVPRLTVKLGDGAACTGPVTYETEYGVFSADGQHRLDIGI
jgi:hypothetical protein